MGIDLEQFVSKAHILYRTLYQFPLVPAVWKSRLAATIAAVAIPTMPAATSMPDMAAGDNALGVTSVYVHCLKEMLIA